MTWDNDELFGKYELLFPPKNEGGLLVLSLYHKIKTREIDNYFTANDIRTILERLARQTNESVPQSERIIKNLLHFFIRNVPGEPGKYYLTDHAESVVELMKHKLENPYKNFPLKQSFEKYFTLRTGEIKIISDLERRFGKEFVSGHKRIINNHLSALEDELSDAYNQLNLILQSDEQDATVLVKKFVNVFKTFGERAEDITNAISSKDKFLRSLRERVDEFYAAVELYPHQPTLMEPEELNRLKDDWRTAKEILNDMEEFFQNVDYKISNIRKQILNASGKLSELHENFSARAYFRLKVRKLYRLSLTCAGYGESETIWNVDFPAKSLVYEKVRLFYPDQYDFGVKKLNAVVQIPVDLAYQQEKLKEIQIEVSRQEVITGWVAKGKEMLEQHPNLNMAWLMNSILEQEQDYTVAHHVAIELSQFIAESIDHSLTIEEIPEPLNNVDITIWKMNLRKLQTTPF